MPPRGPEKYQDMGLHPDSKKEMRRLDDILEKKKIKSGDVIDYLHKAGSHINWITKEVFYEVDNGRLRFGTEDDSSGDSASSILDIRKSNQGVDDDILTSIRSLDYHAPTAPFLLTAHAEYAKKLAAGGAASNEIKLCLKEKADEIAALTNVTQGSTPPSAKLAYLKTYEIIESI